MTTTEMVLVSPEETVVVETTITKTAAMDLTSEINRRHGEINCGLADLAVLVAAARDRCVWEPLGLPNFAAWAEQELAMGKSRAYQLAEHGVVLGAIREVARSTAVELPERATRGWKTHLEVVLDHVADVTSEASDEAEAAAAVLEAVPEIDDHVRREHLEAMEARRRGKKPTPRLSRAEHLALRQAQAEQRERERVEQIPSRMLLNALDIRNILDELDVARDSAVQAAVETIFGYVDSLVTRAGASR